MPKAVRGTIIAVLIYSLIYLIASFYQDAVMTIPAGTIYLLFIYALVGCLGMVVVLPFMFLSKKK